MAGKIIVAFIVLAAVISLSTARNDEYYKCLSCHFRDAKCVYPIPHLTAKVTCSINDLGCYTLYDGHNVKRGCLRSWVRLKELLKIAPLTDLCKEEYCNSELKSNWEMKKSLASQ